MTIAIIRYETRGIEVYESENGPTIGYDDIQTGWHIMPLDLLDGDTFNPEDYRSVEVVYEIETIGM